MPREAPGSVRNRKKEAERKKAPSTQAQIRGEAAKQRRENSKAANSKQKQQSSNEEYHVTIQDFHSGARLSAMEKPELKGFCFPECTNADILSQLEILIPHLTIFKYNTGTFPEVFQNFINGLRSLSMGSIGHDKDQDDTLKSLYEKLVKSISNTTLPPSINLLFCSLPCDPDCRIRLPITSSPLSINSQLDHGWKANQSIFDFIKKQLGGSGFSSTFGKLFGEKGESVLKFGTDVANLTENLMHIFGRDIQLGPYWSIGEGALDNRQSLSFSTILVNDSKEHYEGNAEVLRKLFVESQPNALEDIKGLFRIMPPSIFDIELDTCTAGKKKYFLCAGQFGCEPKGRYYIIDNKKIPEAYSLSLTFNSLIPDLLKIQQEKGVYHA